MDALKTLSLLYEERGADNFIPYSYHLTDNIIASEDGKYVSVWKITGKSHIGHSYNEYDQWLKELNNSIIGSCSDKISLWTHIVRRKIDISSEASFSNSFARDLDVKYRKSLKEKSLMTNDLYLSIVYNTQSEGVFKFYSKLEARFFTSSDEKKRIQERSIEEFEEINRNIGEALSTYGAKNLGIYDDKGFSFSETLEFISLLTDSEKRKVPVCRNPISDYVAANRTVFSGKAGIGKIVFPNKEKYFGMLEIFDYPSATEAGHLNTLLSSDYEFILTNSFSCISKMKAKSILENRRFRMAEMGDTATYQIEQFEDALNGLMSGDFMFGHHHATINVFGESIEEVKDSQADAINRLADVAIIAKKIDLALIAAYWAQLPSNYEYIPRKSLISSLNFLSFSSFHNFMRGKETGNPWGNAVTLFRSEGNTPLNFSFHNSPLNENSEGKMILGNTKFIGKSGTGKSVLMAFTLAQATKLGVTACVFDKDRGLQTVIMALGGKYLSLKNGEPSGFNPLKIEKTIANIDFLGRFIKVLATTPSIDISHRDEQEIDDAINMVMTQPKEIRNFQSLLQCLPREIRHDDRPSVYERLKKWEVNGKYGWLFDNEDDGLNLETHQIYGFDVTDFLENQEIREPLMMYLLYRTESMIDGRRFIYMFDEFQKALEDKNFQEMAQNSNRVIRKKNGIFIYATQEPGAILDNPIGKTLVQQCATSIYLPNPDADKKEYIDGFKLTPDEFRILKSLGETSRKFLIKQGEYTAVAELKLNGFDDEILILSGNPQNAEIAEKLVERLGDEPKNWIPEYLVRVKENRGLK